MTQHSSRAAKRSSRTKRPNGAKRNGTRAVSDHRPTYAPSNKTVGATLGSAVSGIALYFANRAWPGMVTPEIAGMFTVVATFAIGWIVPPGEREGVVVTERGRRTAVA